MSGGESNILYRMRVEKALFLKGLVVEKAFTFIGRGGENNILYRMSGGESNILYRMKVEKAISFIG